MTQNETHLKIPEWNCAGQAKTALTLSSSDEFFSPSSSLSPACRWGRGWLLVWFAPHGSPFSFDSGARYLCVMHGIHRRSYDTKEKRHEIPVLFTAMSLYMFYKSRNHLNLVPGVNGCLIIVVTSAVMQIRISMYRLTFTASWVNYVEKQDQIESHSKLSTHI